MSRSKTDKATIDYIIDFFFKLYLLKMRDEIHFLHSTWGRKRVSSWICVPAWGKWVLWPWVQDLAGILSQASVAQDGLCSRGEWIKGLGSCCLSSCHCFSCHRGAVVEVDELKILGEMLNKIAFLAKKILPHAMFCNKEVIWWEKNYFQYKMNIFPLFPIWHLWEHRG